MNFLIYLTSLLRRVPNVSLLSVLMDSSEFGRLITSSLFCENDDRIFSAYELMYQMFKTIRTLDYKPTQAKWQIKHPIQIVTLRLRSKFLVFGVVPWLRELFMFWKVYNEQPSFITLVDCESPDGKISSKVKSNFYFVLINRRPSVELFELVDLAKELLKIQNSPFTMQLDQRRQSFMANTAEH